MEGPLTEADAKPSSGSISQIASQVKDEPQSRANCDPVMETQPDSSSPTLEVKVEQKESESKEESTTSKSKRSALLSLIQRTHSRPIE